MNIRRDRSSGYLVWVVLGLLALFVLLVLQGCGLSARDIDSNPREGNGAFRGEGDPAPDFALLDLEGNSITLSQFRGNVVFINFWATWCPPCRAEMPEIEALYREYQDQGVVVIGVDIAEPEDMVRKYLRRGGYSWNFVLDTTGKVSNDFRVTSLPTSFFLDRTGVVRAIGVGGMTKRNMESKLAEAMGG